MTGRPLAEADFREIYRQVPRLTVEVIVRDDRGVFLTCRDAGPCKGLWHIPGGTVWFTEPLEDAVTRIARDKLGITVTEASPLGWIEYPSHYLNGLDHPVGLAFAVTWVGEPFPLAGASDGDWFTDLPDPMHPEQAAFLHLITAEVVVLAP